VSRHSRQGNVDREVVAEFAGAPPLPFRIRLRQQQYVRLAIADGTRIAKFHRFQLLLLWLPLSLPGVAITHPIVGCVTRYYVEIDPIMERCSNAFRKSNKIVQLVKKTIRPCIEWRLISSFRAALNTKQLFSLFDSLNPVPFHNKIIHSSFHT
jgi:hypothetical protein